MTEPDSGIPSSEAIAVFESCGRCSLTLRRSEMQIHLAHSHNIGPVRKSDKDKKHRGARTR